MHVSDCMNNEVCKLFALTDGAVIWSMLEISWEKQNKYKITIEKIIQSNATWNIFVPII